MHSLKRILEVALAATIMIAPAPALATLAAQTLDGWIGTLNLVDSRLTIQVSDQWIDVEEEAELEAVPSSWSDSKAASIATGTINVPKGVAITGCMLWNGDTLLMGKLRGKVQANKIFDSLVPPVTTRWPVDPLLIEQMSETVYNVKLFPLDQGSTRRLRIRYLVPRLTGSSLAVVPLLQQVNGGVPAQFRLRLRGKAEGLRLSTSAGIWPVDLPFSDLVTTATGAKLLWNAASTGAVRGKSDSGRWAGDYVLYSGTVPDSVLRKTSIRSETVVLWSWIQPSSFFDWCACGSWYLSELGKEAFQQAVLINRIAERTGMDGGRMGLVADLGMDEPPRTYPLADSSSKTYKSMRGWLSGITEDYLRALIIPDADASGNGTGFVSGRDAAKLRQRFQVDLREVGSLYSADSGVIRHLVVVTAGLSASSARLEQVDPSLLPRDVSLASSRLLSKARNVYRNGYYTVVYDPPEASSWPGVDLAGFAAEHPQTSRLESYQLQAWSDVMLPKTRVLTAARLSIGSGAGAIRRNVTLTRDAQGRLVASLNVHAPSLSKAVTWEVFDDSGMTLQSWNVTPSWTDVGSDSVLPRLWAKSEAPIAPSLEGQDLGPIYGVVDRFHSLLATPSDTVGSVRQKALRDSGVPFLTYAEIFPRQGYGTEAHTGGGEEGDAVHGRASRAALRMSWIAALRTLHIDLSGLAARGIEIRDLQGRLLASIPASQLAGLSSLDWKAPAGLARGLLLVTVRTDAGMRTGRVMVH